MGEMQKHHTLKIYTMLGETTNLMVHNAEYMASSQTQMIIRITKFNNQQIVSKMPDTAICYIHC